MRHVGWLVVFVGIGACAKPSEPVTTSTQAQAQTAVATRVGAVADVDAPQPGATSRPDACAEPTCWASLEQRLRARHDEDLPDRAALDRLPQSEAGLTWLAGHADTLLVRARALDLLGLYAGDAARGVLLAALTDTSSHDKLRRAAVLGLARFDLATDTTVRAALVARLADDDTGVALEAAGVLVSVPSAAAEIDTQLAAGRVDPAVRVRLGR